MPQDGAYIGKSYQNCCAAVRRARPVLGILMHHSYVPVLSAPSAPT